MLPQPDAETEKLALEFSALPGGTLSLGPDLSQGIRFALNLEDVKRLAEALREYEQDASGAE